MAIEDGIVNIVAVVKILASRRGTSTSWRHQHVGSLNLPLRTDLACELIFRPLGCLVFARDRQLDDMGSCYCTRAVGRLQLDMAFELQEGPIVNFSGCRASMVLRHATPGSPPTGKAGPLI